MNHDVIAKLFAAAVAWHAGVSDAAVEVHVHVGTCTYVLFTQVVANRSLVEALALV